MVGNIDEYWVAEKSNIVYDVNAPVMPQSSTPQVCKNIPLLLIIYQ